MTGGDSKAVSKGESPQEVTGGSIAENLGDINGLLEQLGSRLRDPNLKSSSRMLMIITLSINRRLTFTDLLQLTSLGKGSLSNHIDKLREDGLVSTRTVFSFSGPRLVVEITESGMEVYRDYLSLMRRLLELQG